MRGGGEGGNGESPESSHPLPESVTEDFMTKIVKRRFHFSWEFRDFVDIHCLQQYEIFPPA